MNAFLLALILHTWLQAALDDLHNYINVVIIPKGLHENHKKPTHNGNDRSAKNKLATIIRETEIRTPKRSPQRQMQMPGNRNWYLQTRTQTTRHKFCRPGNLHCRKQAKLQEEREETRRGEIGRLLEHQTRIQPTNRHPHIQTSPPSLHDHNDNSKTVVNLSLSSPEA